LSTGNAFMVGSDLLVAQSPYPDELDDYQVALPPSSWYDYWTGSRIDASSGRKGIDNAAIAQPEVHIHRTLETLPVFVKAGSIVPEQPLVESTDEKPVGPLTLRVYPPTTLGADCEGSVYLDDGVSYDFKKGEFLRVQFACRLSTQGLIVTVAPRKGTFQPWWKLLEIEVYGATKPYSNATVTTLDHTAPVPISTNFDAEHHRVTALVADDAKGMQLQLTY
jgi:alpha-glucosidase